jgi:hypothetical protein
MNPTITALSDISLRLKSNETTVEDTAYLLRLAQKQARTIELQKNVITSAEILIEEYEIECFGYQIELADLRGIG